MQWRHNVCVQRISIKIALTSLICACLISFAAMPVFAQENQQGSQSETQPAPQAQRNFPWGTVLGFALSVFTGGTSGLISAVKSYAVGAAVNASPAGPVINDARNRIIKSAVETVVSTASPVLQPFGSVVNAIVPPDVQETALKSLLGYQLATPPSTISTSDLKSPGSDNTVPLQQKEIGTSNYMAPTPDSWYDTGGGNFLNTPPSDSYNARLEKYGAEFMQQPTDNSVEAPAYIGLDPRTENAMLQGEVPVGGTSALDQSLYQTFPNPSTESLYQQTHTNTNSYNNGSADCWWCALNNDGVWKVQMTGGGNEFDWSNQFNYAGPAQKFSLIPALKNMERSQSQTANAIGGMPVWGSRR